ncbi:MAG: VTT domain-containing protein [Anaerolineales bacterium]|nr:VTT domain-containing protein [Anaerolineales bacterium]
MPAAPPSRPPAAKPLGVQLARLAVLVIVIGITIAIYSLGDQTAALAAYGYPGLFLLSILANATIVLPAPGLALVFVFAGKLSPLGVGLAAAAGATLGELSGYLAGFSGQAIIENRGLYQRLEGYMRRYGALTIVILAFLPLPIFDLAGVAAGALKLPVQKFLFWCFLGKLPKMLLIALAGAYSIGWVAGLLR